MIEMKRWEIWEADVPFAEKRGSKRRPVVVLSQDEVFVISLKMPSHKAFTGKQYGRLNATDIIGLQAMLKYMRIND